MGVSCRQGPLGKKMLVSCRQKEDASWARPVGKSVLSRVQVPRRGIILAIYC